MRASLQHEFLQESVTKLPRCGPAISSHLKKIGISTIDDLLHHFPMRYEDHSEVSDVRDAAEGQFITVRARLAQLRARQAFRRGRMHVTEGLATDETGSIRVVWFGQPYILKSLAVGDEVFLTGKVKRDGFGLQMNSPSFEKTTVAETIHTAGVIPMYGLTDGVGQKQFRTLVKAALDKLGVVDDWIPGDVLDEFKFLSYDAALRRIHFPADVYESGAARQRFQFDQAFLQQLNQLVVKKYNESVKGCSLPMDIEVVKNFIGALPFELTEDQKKSAFAILKDMEASHPMNRLLQGDVGSGKTVVAAIAMAHAASHGCTSILLAPTQILAQQHVVTLEKIFAAAEIPIVLMTAATKKTVKLPKGPSIIVGTHALLHTPIKFPQLGLVVVDEQHRFGVSQRKAIKEKNKAGYTPHFLSMSATPIPRSLSLALFGSLAISSIRQMPRGRKAIMTRAVEDKNRSKAEQFVREHVAKGEQVFVVAALIEPSDVLGVESATEIYEKLKKDTFKNLRVALVHGRMKPKERSEIMDEMRAGKIDVLVATAVIEVGVDIPNATIMWIEGAERFGLAQLHQFRGRVGRGNEQSYCFLFSNTRGENAQKRLKLMTETTDGFVLAEKDLEMRGAGDMWGTIQSGFSDIEFLREISLDIWEYAKNSAEKVVSDARVLEKNPQLKIQLERFEQEIHRE